MPNVTVQTWYRKFGVRMRATLRMFSFVLLLTLSSFAHPAASPSATSFDALADRFFDFYFPLHPSAGSSAGFHQFDAKLDDYTAAGQATLANGLKEYLAK